MRFHSGVGKGRGVYLPIERASLRLKPIRSTTTNDQAVMTGARLMMTDLEERIWR
jgi:hypothetical protein